MKSLHFLVRPLPLAIVLTLFSAGPVVAASGGKEEPKVTVQCSRGSGLIQVSVSNTRKIGKVLLEVKDASGRVLYSEEGKAMTGELVRRLDKGLFPLGATTVEVTARDFAVSQHFVIE
ncbi:MAG TPA: hypothetical protein VKG92_03145 [Flavobacteriales bacterium]|nr:hypothetical protein [Flavobacteriales bacterium]